MSRENMFGRILINGVFPDLTIVFWRIKRRYSRDIHHIKQNPSPEFRKNQPILGKYVFSYLKGLFEWRIDDVIVITHRF